ncbi:MAG: hypothetical protein V1818_03090 [Candidatus Aenigmatarchaeota archaeon]
MVMIEQAILTLWNSFLIILPSLIWASIALVVGLLVGKVAGWIIKQFLVRVKLDQYVFEKEKFKMKLSDVFSTLGRWVIYLVFVQVASGLLGIATVINLVNSAITFLAGAIEATVIIIIGYSLAHYIKDKVIHSKTFYGDLVGKVIFFLMLYVSIALALPFVGIDATLINWMLIVIVASLGAGMAIAIGLGMKDVVKDVAKGYSKKFKR